MVLLLEARQQTVQHLQLAGIGHQALLVRHNDVRPAVTRIALVDGVAQRLLAVVAVALVVPDAMPLRASRCDAVRKGYDHNVSLVRTNNNVGFSYYCRRPLLAIFAFTSNTKDGNATGTHRRSIAVRAT